MKNFMRFAIAMAITLAASAAMAEGWSDGVGKVRNLSGEVANMLVYVFFAGGVCAFGFAGKKLWDKGQENRGDDIKATHIIWPMIGGAFLMAISWVAGNTLETLGGGANGSGSTPQLGNIVN